jgi:uncharacterized membrane protein (DUF441 family)
LIAAVAVCAAVGLATLTSGSTLLILLAIAVIGAGALAVPARYRLGVAFGVLIVVGLDVFPGTDLDALIVTSGFHAQDWVVAILCISLLIDNVRYGFGGLFRARIGFALIVSSLLIIMWWLIVLYRTDTEQLYPLSTDANFGRDFLTFAVMTPLFAGSFQRRDVRDAMLAAVACSAVVAALVYFVGTLGHITSVTYLIHLTATRQVNGATRLYAPVEDLFGAAMPLGAGALLLGSSRRTRYIGASVAITGLAAIIAELTRAQYIGSGAGLAIAAVVWTGRAGGGNSRIRRLARQRLLSNLTVVVVATAAVIAVSPQGKVADALNSAGSRLGSVVATATSGNTATSTVAVRLSELSLLEQRLGSHAVLGLGFIDPRDQYDPSLPFGSIRNSDVGLLNVTMTMGIIGTLLYYTPLLLVAVGLALRGRELWPDDAGWLGFGAFAWTVTALITSVTLVTLYSPTGVVSSAAMLGLGAVVLLRPRHSAPARI